MAPAPSSAAEAGRLSACVAALALACGLARPAVAAASVPRPLEVLATTPLHRFTEGEVGAYLAHLQATEPDLRRRVAHLARKNLGQPYELYLLGEAPFETHDPQPLYSLAKSDCVVFTEHTLAMALSRDWTGFFRLLQRIRYRDGVLGVATRNHFTEADWNPANRWLAEDITAALAGDRARQWEARIDRARFLRTRYRLETALPVERRQDTYLPYGLVAQADAHIREGDIIQLVRGVVRPGAPETETFGANAWIGHLGLVVRGPAGELHIVHSAEPAVREEPLAALIARETERNAARDAAGQPRLLGFKFLRLAPDPLANLRALDGPAAPRLILPGALPGS